MQDLGEKTFVGVLTAAIIALGIAIRKGFIWFIGVDQKLRLHDIEITQFNSSLKAHVEKEEIHDMQMRDLLTDISSNIKEMNVKVQLLMEDKIK